jgi:hypothetical protein
MKKRVFIVSSTIHDFRHSLKCIEHIHCGLGDHHVSVCTNIHTHVWKEEETVSCCPSSQLEWIFHGEKDYFNHKSTPST